MASQVGNAAEKRDQLEDLWSRFQGFARDWMANLLWYGVGDDRKAADFAKVRARIDELFVEQFAPLARDFVRTFGEDTFRTTAEPPEPPFPASFVKVQRLTGCTDTHEGARRLIWWSAAVAEWRAFRRDRHWEGNMRGWIQQAMFDPDDPRGTVRAINEWLEWMRDWLNVVLADVGTPPWFRPPSRLVLWSNYRCWRMQRDDWTSPLQGRLLPVPEPCSLLLGWGWESQVVPQDLSVAAIEEWFRFYIAPPKESRRGVLFDFAEGDSRKQPDCGDEVRDAYRIVGALAVEYGWEDKPLEPIGRKETPAHDAKIELEILQRYLRTKRDGDRWQGEKAVGDAGVRPEDEIRVQREKLHDLTETLQGACDELQSPYVAHPSSLASSKHIAPIVETPAAVPTLPKSGPTGFLGGNDLVAALEIAPDRISAFFRQLDRRRLTLGDDAWHEVKEPRPNSPRYLYWVDSPKIQDLAQHYRQAKSR